MWKPSSGGPYMPSTRESLSTTSLSRVELRHLAMAERPDDRVGGDAAELRSALPVTTVR